MAKRVCVASQHRRYREARRSQYVDIGKPSDKESGDSGRNSLWAGAILAARVSFKNRQNGPAKIGTAQRVFCHVTDSYRYASKRPHAITPIHIISDSAACSFAEGGVATPTFQLATDR